MDSFDELCRAAGEVSRARKGGRPRQDRFALSGRTIGARLRSDVDAFLLARQTTQAQDGGVHLATAPFLTGLIRSTPEYRDWLTGLSCAELKLLERGGSLER